MKASTLLRSLTKHLATTGWTFTGARAMGSTSFDYDTLTEAVVDLQIGQDMWVTFEHENGDSGHALIIPSNGEDALSDWTVRSEAFDAAMDAFLTSLWA